VKLAQRQLKDMYVIIGRAMIATSNHACLHSHNFFLLEFICLPCYDKKSKTCLMQYFF